MILDVKIFKVLFVAGLLFLGTAVFVDSYKVASLSALKSSEKRIQMEMKEKYTISAPDSPIDESRYMLPPAALGKEATQEQKDAFEKEKSEYESKIRSMKEKYAADIKTYGAAYKEYQRKQKELDLEKQRNARSAKKLSEKIDRDIEVAQISVNDFIFSTVLRYFGCVILLIGSLGILLFGETYERLGVLVAIGFSLKTVIGL